MPKLEDMKYSGNPFRSRNRIEEALMPMLEKHQTPAPSEPKTPEPKKRTLSLRRLALVVGLVIFAAAFVSGSYLIYRQYRAAKAETPEATIAEVGKYMELPNEKPTIATVSDLEPLKNEPFFQNARVGDKVLIYSAAKKAILYRPSTKKIIIVAPIR